MHISNDNKVQTRDIYALIIFTREISKISDVIVFRRARVRHALLDENTGFVALEFNRANLRNNTEVRGSWQFA